MRHFLLVRFIDLWSTWILCHLRSWLVRIFFNSNQILSKIVVIGIFVVAGKGGICLVGIRKDSSNVFMIVRKWGLIWNTFSLDVEYVYECRFKIENFVLGVTYLQWPKKLTIFGNFFKRGEQRWAKEIEIRMFAQAQSILEFF